MSTTDPTTSRPTNRPTTDDTAIALQRADRLANDSGGTAEVETR